MSDKNPIYMQEGFAGKLVDIIIITILSIMAFITLFPFYNVLIISVARYKDIIQYPLYIIPRAFDFTAYKLLFMDKLLINSFFVSVGITFTGTALSMFVTTMAAYALSKKNLPGRNLLFGIVIFTMYFGGGLIPWYLVIKALGLVNQFAVLILPVALNTFYMILMKNYFLTIPESIEESARIDGANDIYILYKIIIPTAAPIIATISLFYAVDRWNDWWMAMLFISSNQKLPLQNILRKVVIESTLELGNAMANSMRDSQTKIYPKSIQMATVVVTTVPILLIYPFVQKHFTKGILLGSIKA